MEQSLETLDLLGSEVQGLESGVINKERGRSLRRAFGEFTGTLRVAEIIQSAWDEYHETGIRPTVAGDYPIQHGPLAGTRLTWAAVYLALKNGYHGLKPSQNLPDILTRAGLPAYEFTGTLTYLDILTSGLEEYNETGRRPVHSDKGPIQYGPLKDTGLSWAGVNHSLLEGRHGLSKDDGMSLAEFFELSGIPSAKFRGELFYLDIMWELLEHFRATGKRLSTDDKTPLERGSLKGTGMTGQKLYLAFENASHGLCGLYSLSELQDLLGISGGQYKGHLTHSVIAETCWAVYDHTGQRLSLKSTDPIEFGPLAGSGLTGKKINDALRLGFHGLPGGDSLSKLQGRAKIPKFKHERDKRPPRFLPKNENASGNLDVSPAA